MVDRLRVWPDQCCRLALDQNARARLDARVSAAPWRLRGPLTRLARSARNGEQAPDCWQDAGGARGDDEVKGLAIEITERLDEELRQAARKGSAQSLRELLRRGAGVASTDDDGWTTLMLAAASESAECVKMLAPLVDPCRKTRAKVTPLMIAAESGWTEGVELLLAAIESWPDYKRRKSTVLRAELGRRDERGRTSLILAAQSGQAKCVRLLLPMSPVDAADMDGRTALMLAATGREAGSVECVKALLPASDAAKLDQSGRTALCLAAMEGRPEIVELLAFSADPLLADKEGKTAFDMALARGGEDGERICQTLRRAIAEKERGELGEAVGEAGGAASSAVRARSL